MTVSAWRAPTARVLAAAMVGVAAFVVLRQLAHPAGLLIHPATVNHAVAFDESPALGSIGEAGPRRGSRAHPALPLRTGSPGPAHGPERGGTALAPVPGDYDGDFARGTPPADPGVVPAGAKLEQRSQGTRPALPVLASFDGLGAGFVGPQSVTGGRALGNPSDNSLAVGPNHIVQIVNGAMAVFTKLGVMFDSTGKVLYGPMRSNAIFAGFGGPCEHLNSGDAVVRYDQLAERWLYVLPIFSRDTAATVELTRVNRPGKPGQPGEPGPRDLIKTPAPPPPPPGQALPGRGGGRGTTGSPRAGPYSMCYAVSTTSDPLGPYFRYEFLRPLFPDYPRPAIWIDGYYVPSSTSDNFIQKHACVAERAKMLQGLPATEQCLIIDGVNFLNNADIDGQDVPPVGSPNIILAAGGSQLHQIFADDGIYAWQFHVDWNDAARTGLRGPAKIGVAPYHYLCNGQLTNCVPQPDTSRRLDAQGDKLMQRLVYRHVNGHEAVLALHSVNTAAGGGGVRWYEFRLDDKRDPVLFQQGTFAPDSLYRWMPSIGMDRKGNIGIGYSFGGGANFPGQRFAARLATDPPGKLTFHESVLVDGEASQRNQNRWEDYTTTAMDPSDDCTFWYVGDYLRRSASGYATRIGAFRVPGCRDGQVAGSTFFDVNHDGVRDGAEPGLPGRNVRFDGARSGTVVTNAAGAFTVTLPADAAYGRTDYTFTALPVSRPGWTPTPWSGQAGAGVTTSAGGLRVELRDRDYVTGIAFGSVCTVQSSGAHAAAFWLGAGGARVMAARDSNWTRLFDSIFVASAQGTPIHIPRGPAGFDALRGWLPGAVTGTPMQRTSATFAVAGLNVVGGAVDGSATINDPIVGDWPQIRAMLGRASVALAAGNTRAARYADLVVQLNANNVLITPPDPRSCGRRR